MKKTLLTTCFLTVLALPAFADFTNGGFESDSLNTLTGPTGWTLHSGNWNTSGVYFTDANQGLSTVITGTAVTDPYTNGNLLEVLSGTNSYRLNDSSPNYHFSTLSQTVTAYTGNDLYLAFAAVMEDPNHAEGQNPHFAFSIFDQTTSTSIYNVAFDSLGTGAPGIVWHLGTSDWKYTDWSVVHVDTSSLVGHDLSVQVEAYDCALGGHGGYAYVDAFSPYAPVPNDPATPINQLEGATLEQVPEPSSFLLMGVGAAALAFLRRRISK